MVVSQLQTNFAPCAKMNVTTVASLEVNYVRGAVGIQKEMNLDRDDVVTVATVESVNNKDQR